MIGQFRASGKQVIFPGWLKAYDTSASSSSSSNDSTSEGDPSDAADDTSSNASGTAAGKAGSEDAMLPALAVGQELGCTEVAPLEKHTQPPNRSAKSQKIQESGTDHLPAEPSIHAYSIPCYPLCLHGSYGTFHRMCQITFPIRSLTQFAHCTAYISVMCSLQVLRSLLCERAGGTRCGPS